GDRPGIGADGLTARLAPRRGRLDHPVLPPVDRPGRRNPEKVLPVVAPPCGEAGIPLGIVRPCEQMDQQRRAGPRQAEPASAADTGPAEVAGPVAVRNPPPDIWGCRRLQPAERDFEQLASA